MNTKDIIYGEEARQKLKAGVDKIAMAVTTTLGLKGRNVAIGNNMLPPHVVHDGVTVAREVRLKDPFEDIGAQIVKEASSKTNDNVGDGTTTSSLLAQALVERSLKVVSAGANPMIVKRGIEKALTAVVSEIKKKSKPIKTKEEKRQVATISAQDEQIGEMVADALDKVGDDGAVTFTESNGFDLELEIKEGVKIDSGYASPIFSTDKATRTAIMEDAPVLVLDIKLSTATDVQETLGTIMSNLKKIVIVGEVEGDALNTILYNKAIGAFDVLIVKPPLVGSRRKESLEDLAIILGGSLVSEDTGRTLDSITIEDLGKVSRVVCKRDETLFVGGKGDKRLINERVLAIREIIKSQSGMERERTQQRLTTFLGGIAVIKVGASTEGEIKEKKLRVEDAVNATKSAIEMGIVSGGGVALLEAREVIKKLKLSGDELVGANALYESLERPFRKIVENAGVDGGEILAEIRGKHGMGFNVLTMETGNMIEMGVIDPAKVTISALSNAVSVAILVITTDCLIVDDNGKD